MATVYKLSVLVADVTFPATVTVTHDGYVGEVPMLLGCLSQGNSLKECEKNLTNAAASWIDAWARKHKLGRVIVLAPKKNGMNTGGVQLKKRVGKKATAI